MTNEERIRKYYTTEELAHALLHHIYEIDYDNDYSDEFNSEPKINEYFITSDGKKFMFCIGEDYKEALQHEIEWLNSEVNNEKNE